MVISQQEYLRRRQALLANMQPGSAALIFAAPEVTRSADSEYPYRQIRFLEKVVAQRPGDTPFCGSRPGLVTLI